MAVINAAGLAIVEGDEGDVLHAYQDSGGVWTDGYGHTRGVLPGMTITQAQAVTQLYDDLAGAEHAVSSLVEIVLTPNEFSALVSWEFNTGALAGSPGLGLINGRQFVPAWDDHFCLWVHDAAGNALAGLVRRRAQERALFFTPEASGAS